MTNHRTSGGVAGRGEKLAWSMYDFANSGYATVVLTTVFNGYFVAVLAAEANVPADAATFLWTAAVASGNGIVLLTAPVVGAIADYRASKKRFLAMSTAGCVVATALLGCVGPGAMVSVSVLLVVSLVMFGTGEYLIAAFLPEIASGEEMGRTSGYGWGLGYLGGLLTLGCCLVWITWASNRGLDARTYVPVTLWMTAGIFALAALPTFLILRERAAPAAEGSKRGYVATGIARIRQTLRQARKFQDLFRFLVTLVVFQAGMGTVIVVAAIYAQEVLGLDTREFVSVIMIVNLAAAAGAFGVGHLQDRIGSTRALAVALVTWIVGVTLVFLVESGEDIWLPANLIGLAMGATQSAGRALIGRFTPVSRAGEFFGLWGLCTHLAMIIGPLAYGTISWATGGDQRAALLSTLCFFVLALLLLTRVNERRGRHAALAGHGDARLC